MEADTQHTLDAGEERRGVAVGRLGEVYPGYTRVDVVYSADDDGDSVGCFFFFVQDRIKAFQRVCWGVER